MTLIRLVDATIKLEVFTFTINGVICKVHVQVAKITFDRLLIWGSRKSCEAFLKEVNFHGVNGYQKNVKSAIKF